jgi:hypothetical protein
MKVDSLIGVLMRRDGLTKAMALQQILEMRQQVAEGEDPEEVLHDIGLEPDYILDLLW